MHRALPPSEPQDGERPRCFRLAAVGGAQLRGGWHLSAIARLQGFSSGSPAASPHQWSPKTVTTSSMVWRSKPGCGLCPTLSFKDLHHPCWGGGRAEPEPYLPYGSAGHLLLQQSGERTLTGLAEGTDFDNEGPIGRKRRQLQHAWFAGSAGSGTASGATSHRWVECGYLPAVRAAVAPREPGDRLSRRTLLGRRSCSWAVPPSPRHDASARRSVLARPGGLEWGRERGPCRSSVCPEVIAAVVWPPRAEVVVAATGVGGGKPPGILSSRRPSNVGGCSYLREWNWSFVCNGILSAGVCSLWLSGPEHLGILGAIPCFFLILSTRTRLSASWTA
jgi:hypothetical protein